MRSTTNYSIIDCLNNAVTLSFFDVWALTRPFNRLVCHKTEIVGMTVMKISLLLVLFLGRMVFAESVQAEFGVWDTNLSGNRVTLQFAKPNFPRNTYDKIKTVSFASELRARFGRGGINLVVIVPYNTMVFSSRPAPNSDGGLRREYRYPRLSMIGNPYFGIQFTQPDQNSFAELGVWLPIGSARTQDSGARTYGFLTHPLYLEPVLFDAFSIRGLITKISANNHEVLRGKVRIGATLIKPDNSDAEIFADYSVLGWHEGKSHRIGAGVNGRALITEGELDLSERTDHELALFVEVDFNKITPGLRLRMPLGSAMRDVVLSVVDLYVSVAF